MQIERRKIEWRKGKGPRGLRVGKRSKTTACGGGLGSRAANKGGDSWRGGRAAKGELGK